MKLGQILANLCTNLTLYYVYIYIYIYTYVHNKCQDFVSIRGFLKRPSFHNHDPLERPTRPKFSAFSIHPSQIFCGGKHRFPLRSPSRSGLYVWKIGLRNPVAQMAHSDWPVSLWRFSTPRQFLYGFATPVKMAGLVPANLSDNSTSQHWHHL